MAEAGSDSSKSGGAGIYLLGLLVLAAGIVGIIVFTRSKDDPAPPPPKPSASVEEPKILNGPAPPPPPKVDDLPDPSATASAAPSSTAGHGTMVASGGGSGVCSNCKGRATGALSSAVSGLARSAQGCYNRALRTSAASGSMTVAVLVGSTGQVCSASIVNDSVGSGEISSCVVQRFQGASLPPPEDGCVTVNVPITFKLAN